MRLAGSNAGEELNKELDVAGGGPAGGRAARILREMRLRFAPERGTGLAPRRSGRTCWCLRPGEGRAAREGPGAPVPALLLALLGGLGQLWVAKLGRSGL